MKNAKLSELNRNLGRIWPGLMGAAVGALIIVAGGSVRPALAEGPTPVPEAVVVRSSTGPASPIAKELNTLAATGKLPDLIYPDFSDDEGEIATFYQEGGYAPVWFVGGKLTPQASELIKRFGSAQAKGLNPDDYDGPRWAARVAALTAAWPANGQAESAQANDLA